MPDDFLSRIQTPPARPQPRTGRTMLIVALLAFMLGAALIGWLAWRGSIPLLPSAAVEPVGTTLPVTTPTTTGRPGVVPSLAPGVAAIEAVLDQRVVALEDRIARIDLQAQAAAGNAGRAEGLLIALAARRAIERGAPLGYLEDQLKLRFAQAQPNAVATIVAAAAQPTTLDRLVAGLDVQGPALTRQASLQSGWGRLRSEVVGLFVIRRDGAPSARVEDRLAEARLLLQTGQIDAAVTVVAGLPGAASASQWLSAARRYAAAGQALDLIETTALLEPRELLDGTGSKVEQPSPVAQPAG